MFRKSVPVFSIIKGSHPSGNILLNGNSTSEFLSPNSFKSREKKLEAMGKAERALKVDYMMKEIEKYHKAKQ